MSDKPDVAALVEWLQTWSPVTANGQRAHLAAAALTRLEEAQDQAEAEIARLRDVIRIAKDALRGHDPEQPYMKAIRAALKPDTGEQLIAELHVSGTKEEWLAALAANREDAALKPDTGE